jgi:hypothetical protein
MQKHFTTICTAMVCAFIWMASSSAILAQSGDKMSYQAILRNAGGQLLINQKVTLKVNIRIGQAGGTIVFSEQHQPTTNENGLISINIGGGNPILGSLGDISWNSGAFFIETQIDPKGGSQFEITTSSPLHAVPYAFHAKSADKLSVPFEEKDPFFTASVAAGITNADTLAWNNKQEMLQAGDGIEIENNVIQRKKDAFYVGQDTLGGIVFYIYLDQKGQQKGLIVSKSETNAAWQSLASSTSANRSWDGPYNTARMTNSPARTWLLNNFDDEWYLPSIDELSTLYHNRMHVNAALHQGGHTLLSHTAEYWSSTEANTANAHNFHFLYGSAYLATNKTNAYLVRPIRAF